ncbi:hypothetical protein [Demequina sp. NBRC 110054]|uniref:hypothetical protein n=1 Tax=Demequina sp. NBRC 110054 TaxID=1570343 RepID=UPI000A041AD1|nr:hypothetical protein [Demequina sp. NBRC 110054]
MTTTTPAVAPGPARPFDVLRAWSRPVAALVVVAVPAGLLWWLHPAASLVVLVPAAFVAWRLRGSGLEPWLPQPVDRFPDSVTDPRRRAYARDLRWRWEHAMVVGGLGSYGPDGAYSGPTLTAVSQHGTSVVAHATMLPGQSVRDVDACHAALAAGLEAAETSLLGGTQDTFALLITERDAGEGWT